MTLAEVQVKWSVISIDRLGPDIFSTLRMKGHVLHRAQAHLKVPGCSLVWNTLLTKKLPMFLSRLNAINGVCEKILPVSGSFWSNISFLEWLISLRGCEGEMWEWMEFSCCSLFVTSVVLTVDQFVVRDDGPLKQQKQDSYVCWKNCTFPLILVKNQSQHYKDDKVYETENKEWNSWHVMDVKMNTTNNYENLWVCSAR